MSSFLCIGHRGARGYEPENTLRSIRRAFDLGAHGVEIDVHFVAGELIVIHDERLERTTNGKGALSGKTLAELRSLDAGQGEKIPTLREAIETVGTRGFLNIELKGRRTAQPVAALIQEFIDEHGFASEQFLVSSFRRRELKQISIPGVRVGILCMRPTPLYYLSARRLRAWSIHPGAKSVTARFVEDAHRRGYQVLPYTVNEPAEIARLRALGVDGVFTDFPDRVT